VPKGAIKRPAAIPLAAGTGTPNSKIEILVDGQSIGKASVGETELVAAGHTHSR